MENETSIVQIVKKSKPVKNGIPIVFESIADKFVYLEKKKGRKHPNINDISIWIESNVSPYYTSKK